MGDSRRRFSAAELAELTQFLFDGFSVPEIAFYFDISIPFVRKVRDGEALPQIKRGVLKQKQHYIAEIRDGTAKHWSRIAWFLERRYPKEFARPEVQLSMSEHVTTNNTLVVSAEVAEALLKRSKAVTTEIDSLLDAKRPDMSSASQASHEGETDSP